MPMFWACVHVCMCVHQHFGDHQRLTQHCFQHSRQCRFISADMGLEHCPGGELYEQVEQVSAVRVGQQAYAGE